LAGCATSVERKDEFVRARIDSSQSTYVALPPDGGSDGRILPGSGQKTQAVMTRILSAYLRNVTNGHRVESTEQALATARSRRVHFLFVPRVLHWEDHRTEYSGRRDRVQVAINVYEVPGGNLVGATTVVGVGKSWSSGDQQPEHLLVDPIGTFVLKLLGYLPPDHE
jgi:hypothetical protein